MEGAVVVEEGVVEAAIAVLQRPVWVEDEVAAVARI